MASSTNNQGLIPSPSGALGPKGHDNGGPRSFSPKDLTFEGPSQSLEELRADIERLKQ